MSYEQRSLDALGRAIGAALRDEGDAVVDAVSQMDEESARLIWAALERVQEQIEASDGGADGRPWEES